MALASTKKLIYLRHFINLTWLKFFQFLIELTSTTMRPLSVAVAINTSLLITLRKLDTRDSEFFSGNSLKFNLKTEQQHFFALFHSCWTLKRYKERLQNHQNMIFKLMHLKSWNKCKTKERKKHFLQGTISSSNWITADPRTKKNKSNGNTFLTGFCAANRRLIKLSKNYVALILSPSTEKQISKKNQAFFQPLLFLLPLFPKNICLKPFLVAKKKKFQQNIKNRYKRTFIPF